MVQRPSPWLTLRLPPRDSTRRRAPSRPRPEEKAPYVGLTVPGALAGMVAGAVLVAVWGNTDGGPGGIFDLYELLPAFVGHLAVAVGVSLLGRPDPAVSQEFDRAVAGLRA